MNTEIEIPVSELKSVLPGLSKTLARNSALPVLNCVKLALSADQQRLCLQTHNLDEIITVQLANQREGIPGEMLVPLELINRLIKGCPADQFMRFIAQGEETRLRHPVGGSYVERRVARVPVEHWPEVKLLSEEFTPLAEQFKECLAEALECASTDSSRYILNGAALDVREAAAHYIVGTDGRHLYSANTFHFNLPGTLVIPSRKFLVWPGFVNDGGWQLRMRPGTKSAENKPEEPPWFEIQSERWSYRARAIEGTYPNWKQAIPGPAHGSTRVELDDTAVALLLEALPLLPGNEGADRPVTLSLGTGLILQARGKESQWTAVPVPGAKVTGKPVAVTVNRNYLLKPIRLGFRHAAIGNSYEAMVFSHEGGKSLVIMPLRLNSPLPATGKQVVRDAEIPAGAEPKPNPSMARITKNQSHGKEGHDTRSSFMAACEQVLEVKRTLKTVLTDLGQVLSGLKTAEKEQRATLKEIEEVRSKLRDIQNVAS